jgi:hypothetical protein
MSRIVTVILIYHRHNPTDLNNYETSLKNESVGSADIQILFLVICTESVNIHFPLMTFLKGSLRFSWLCSKV